MGRIKKEDAPVCDGCGTKLDGFSEVDKDHEKPLDGDISVCIYCAMVGTYADNLTRIKKLTFGEEIELKMCNPETYSQIQRAIKVIKTNPKYIGPKDENKNTDL